MISAIRIALLVYVALLAFPLRFYAIEPGLDPSWAFALKWFHTRGLKYGQDLALTWGPLGHLAIAMHVNGGLTVEVLGRNSAGDYQLCVEAARHELVNSS